LSMKFSIKLKPNVPRSYYEQLLIADEQLCFFPCNSEEHFQSLNNVRDVLNELSKCFPISMPSLAIANDEVNKILQNFLKLMTDALDTAIIRNNHEQTIVECFPLTRLLFFMDGGGLNEFDIFGNSQVFEYWAVLTINQQCLANFIKCVASCFVVGHISWTACHRLSDTQIQYIAKWANENCSKMLSMTEMGPKINVEQLCAFFTQECGVEFKGISVKTGSGYQMKNQEHMTILFDSTKFKYLNHELYGNERDFIRRPVICKFLRIHTGAIIRAAFVHVAPKSNNKQNDKELTLISQMKDVDMINGDFNCNNYARFPLKTNILGHTFQSPPTKGIQNVDQIMTSPTTLTSCDNSLFGERIFDDLPDWMHQKGGHWAIAKPLFFNSIIQQHF